jgi:hypothetical protein
LQRGIDFGDVDVIELVHRDGGRAVDQRIGRFDLADCRASRLKDSGALQRGRAGFMTVVLRRSVNPDVRSMRLLGEKAANVR